MLLLLLPWRRKFVSQLYIYETFSLCTPVLTFALFFHALGCKHSKVVQKFEVLYGVDLKNRIHWGSYFSGHFSDKKTDAAEIEEIFARFPYLWCFWVNPKNLVAKRPSLLERHLVKLPPTGREPQQIIPVMSVGRWSAPEPREDILACGSLKNLSKGHSKSTGNVSTIIFKIWTIFMENFKPTASTRGSE